MKMCTTDVVLFVQQGSVEGSGLDEEASAKYGITAQTCSFGVSFMHVVFCRNA